MTLQVALNPNCKNKESPEAIASGWLNVECDLEYLLEWAANKGLCWAATHFADQYRSAANARGSNLIAVDIDGDCTLEAFWSTEIAQQHCQATYTSCSHTNEQHRFRAIFVLEERAETSAEHASAYHVLALKLTSELKLPGLKDNSGAKPERAWFGHSGAEVTYGERKEVLPAHWKSAAISDSFEERGPLQEASDLEIKQCLWLIAHALRPSEDGEYEYWARITAACSSTGDQLYEAWRDWCAAGHHGSESRHAEFNCSASKYRSFNRGHWLALFKEAKEQMGPGWKAKLPAALQDMRPPLDPLPLDLSDYIQEKFEQEAQAAEVLATAVSEPTPAEGAPAPAAPLDPEEWLTDEMRAHCGGRANAQTVQYEVSALTQLLPGVARNTLTDRIEYQKNGRQCVVQGNYLATLTSHYSCQFGLYIPKERLADHVEYLATRNQYCPIQRYLKRVQFAGDYPKWDRLGLELLGIDGPLATQVLQRFLIGSVARAFNPGCAMDWMPVLVGEQGAGKSQFAAHLAPPELFAEMPASLPKLQAEPYRLHVAWVLELPEVDALFKSNMREEFKNLISTRTDVVRRPYDRYPTSLKRKFCFIGTTNTKTFLNDPTGNRRFIPLQLPEGEEVPWRKLDGIRDQLWATALKHYRSNVRYVYHSGEIKEINDYLVQFKEEDAWIEQISAYIDDYEEVSINEILIHLGIDPKNQTTTHTKRASAILTELGWANNGKRRKVGKSKIRVWEAPAHLRPMESAMEETF